MHPSLILFLLVPLALAVGPARAESSAATLGMVAFIPASCGVSAPVDRAQPPRPPAVLGVHVRCSAGTGAVLHARAGPPVASVAARMQLLAAAPVDAGAVLTAGARPAAAILQAPVAEVAAGAEGVTAMLVYSP